MTWKAEFTVQTPIFDELIIFEEAAEGEAYQEAERLIKRAYPEATDFEIIKFEEIEE